MSLQELFATMQEKNIVISELEGELVIRSPQGAMDQALMSKLKAHKQDLLAALKDGWVTAKPDAAKITPDMLPLVSLTQNEIDLIIDGVSEGAAGIQDIYPLAPLQEGILFHHLLETQGDPYITRSIIVFDNRASLDAFLGALQTVIDRHDILRSWCIAAQFCRLRNWSRSSKTRYSSVCWNAPILGSFGWICRNRRCWQALR
jgi:hypothetical protein